LNPTEVVIWWSSQQASTYHTKAVFDTRDEFRSKRNIQICQRNNSQTINDRSMMNDDYAKIKTTTKEHQTKRRMFG
jgi:hypothetical protein